MPYLIMQRKVGEGNTGGPSDPYWNDVSLLLHMDGVNNGTAFTDEKGHTLTPHGSVITSTSEKKYGTASGYFPATGTYILVDQPVVPATGMFTIEAWVYPINVTTQRVILSQYYLTTPNRWTFGINTSGRLYLSHTAGTITGNGSINLNQWNHVAVTRNNSNQLEFFINGTLDKTTAFSSTLAQVNTEIGRYNNSSGNYYQFYGYIDEVRVTSGVARYTSNYTVPTAAFPNS